MKIKLTEKVLYNGLEGVIGKELNAYVDDAIYVSLHPYAIVAGAELIAAGASADDFDNTDEFIFINVNGHEEFIVCEEE